MRIFCRLARLLPLGRHSNRRERVPATKLDSEEYCPGTPLRASSSPNHGNELMQRTQREIRNVFFFLAMGCAALMVVGCDDGVYDEEPDDTYVPGTTEMDDTDYIAPENDADYTAPEDDTDYVMPEDDADVLPTDGVDSDETFESGLNSLEETEEPADTTGLFEGASPEDTSPLNLDESPDDAEASIETDEPAADSSPEETVDTGNAGADNSDVIEEVDPNEE